jgi:regulator of protease activity HflC (stomatin/prohibitin superfamily)
LLRSPLTLQFYKLTNSHSQISSYVFDVVRASVPKMNLDDVFLEKEAIARSIQEVSLQYKDMW